MYQCLIDIQVRSILAKCWKVSLKHADNDIFFTHFLTFNSILKTNVGHQEK